MKKLLLILLLFIASAFGTGGYYEMSDGVLRLVSADGTKYISMSPLVTASANIDWTWPTNAGSGGQALLTNGANVLSWGTPSTSAAHNFLSATHSDTTTTTAVKGDIIYALSNGDWRDLPIGSNDDYLRISAGLPDWQATTSITTLGTIVTGVWQATDVGVLYGGTGASSLNDLIALTTHTTGSYVTSVATTSPLTGGAGASEGATLTIDVTVAKDIVTTSPITVNAGASLDNVIIGTDADITIAIGDADDDGSTKGAASFDNTDFDAVSGNVTINDDGHDHTASSVSGFMLDAGTPVDNTLVRFDGTDGVTTQVSGITVDDSNNMSAIGTIDSGAITSTGTITILNSTPILVFKDSDSLGAASVGFIEWRDAGGGRAGFLGNNTSGNDDLLWKNEQGGNIGIQTTGAGKFQIFANVELNDNSITGMGNITGSDVDIEAGIGDFNSTGTIGSGAITATDTSLFDSDISIASGSITSAGGTIDFGNEILQTTGNLGVGAAAVSSQIIHAEKNISASVAVGVFGGISNTLSTDSSQSVHGLNYTSTAKVVLKFFSLEYSPIIYSVAIN